MNEYQDQTLWWEVQRWVGPQGHRREWIYISDHGSREDANDWLERYQEVHPDVTYRVQRVTGLPD